MYQLVYVSTATTGFGSQELASLLEVARRNNSADGVSGMLLHHEGNFFQVLEGQEDAVKRIFERVEQDPRHQAVTVIHEEEVDEPAFGDWSMAWCEMQDKTLREMPGFNDLMVRRNPRDAFGSDPQTVHNMVLTFREYAR